MNLFTAAEQEADKSRELNFRDFSLPGVRDKVAEILSLIGRDGIFSTYTIHNISHIDAMLGMLDWLIPESTRKVLTPVDWLLIVLSIYLHDLGLVVTTQEFDERHNNPEFVNWFASLSTNTEGREFLGRTRRMNEEEKQRFSSFRNMFGRVMLLVSVSGSPVAIRQNGGHRCDHWQPL